MQEENYLECISVTCEMIYPLQFVGSQGLSLSIVVFDDVIQISLVASTLCNTEDGLY